MQNNGAYELQWAKKRTRKKEIKNKKRNKS
jgi:hypothetical protein